MQDQPLVSFILIAYNQEKYIREAVEGAFAQTYSPLEIILSDDCSSDNTFKIMEDMTQNYHGQHQIKLNRNEKNLGLAEHVNHVFRLAKGSILVLAAGDDISMPARTKTSVNILKSEPNLNCVSFETIKFTHSHEFNIPNAKNVDYHSNISRYNLEDLIKNNTLHTNGASRALRKSIFDYFGTLEPNSPTEDSTYLLRCLLRGKVAQVKEPMVFYRVHGNNIFASNNKYKIDYDAIFRQYIKDIDLIKNRGDLDKYQEMRLVKSLRKKLSRNKLLTEFYFSNQKRIFFLRKILFSRCMRLKQKIRYFQKSFMKIQKI